MPSRSQDMQQSIASAVRAIQAGRPLRAEEICRDFLVLNPGCVEHLRLLGHSLMKQNRLQEAETQYRLALSLQPDHPQLHEDVGSILSLQGRYQDAVPCFEKAIRLEPRLPLAHKKLGQALAALGRGAEADEEFLEFFEKSPDKQTVATGIEHLKAGREEEAIKVLRAALRDNPDNVDAMRFLAVSYWQVENRLGDAEALLRRAVNVAPDYTAAWLVLGMVLLEQNKYLDAIDSLKNATRLEPDNAAAWGNLGNVYSQAGYPDEAERAFARSLKLQPENANVLMGQGHTLKTLGDQAGSLRAYRSAIRIKPDFGEVYWSMANLKTFRFSDQEIEAMETQLQRDDLSDSADIHFRFSLGKACEDKGDYDKAWHYYHTGNRRQRANVSFDPLEMEERHNNIYEVFTREFIDAHTGNGDMSPDPVLILGLPRSGSTLVEQILASHSQVEGTAELPELGKLAASIGRYRPDGVQFPRAALDLRKKDWRAYGQQYLEQSRRHRVTEKPFFTDKMPNNFPLVGLLHLILPNAKVINARRHPLDTCLGCYKQLFGRGQNFTYDVMDLALYYRYYDEMIRHWHAVLPGKVLDVHYEDTVSNLETQVRRILAHCGLPFEENCLRFYETDRPVKTASSEQVRQPIYTGALGKWRCYGKHLGAWQEELAEIIVNLPESVKNAGL